jgi:4a-hydroxytetrahydrobiopterin dehydratase
MAIALSAEEIAQGLTVLPDWQLDGTAITRNFVFGDFIAAMRFVNSVAELAEAEGHHPDIDIRYNRVKLASWSHDAGGITRRDLHLAARINELS